jgi:hypothetical protein
MKLVPPTATGKTSAQPLAVGLATSSSRVATALGAVVKLAWTF